MEVQFIEFKDLEGISNFDRAYAEQAENLRPFLQYSPSLDSFKLAIEQRRDNEVDRELLINTLHRQYDLFENVSESTRIQIDRLSDKNTFTITTAHQPNLFTGPLYHIYKILSCIKLCRILKKKYTRCNFIPIYVMGAEDHDFEEVNHLHLFGTKVSWDREPEGSVGRMDTRGIEEVIDAVSNILGQNHNLDPLFEFCRSRVYKVENYGQFHLELIHYLFSNFELLVLSMDRSELKAAMTSIFLDDLTNHSSKSIISETQKELQQAGYAPQAFVRDINLFLMQNGRRDRIEVSGNGFEVLNNGLHIASQSLHEFMAKNVGDLSPNVILRPLFQETILPNLAYLGGGGELAYWTDRKKQFEHYNLPFPILVRRDSIIWMDAGTQRKLEKLDLDRKSLLSMGIHQLEKKYVHDHSENELSLSQEIQDLDQIFERISNKAVEIDGSLKGKVAGMKVQFEKQIGGLEKRLVKTQKQRFEQSLGQLHKLKEKVFPKGKLQERYDNFLPYYAKWGPGYFDNLIEQMNPLDMRIKVINAG